MFHCLNQELLLLNSSWSRFEALVDLSIASKAVSLAKVGIIVFDGAGMSAVYIVYNIGPKPILRQQLCSISNFALAMCTEKVLSSKYNRRRQ